MEELQGQHSMEDRESVQLQLQIDDVHQVVEFKILTNKVEDE